VVVANWVVEALDRHAGLSHATAGPIGALTLLLGIVTRPLGGWILRRHGDRVTTAVLAASLVSGAAGTVLVSVASSAAAATIGAALLGAGAGISFAPAFTWAARTRPDAPGAAVGLVNGVANAVVLVATPLVGLTFALPGEGRIGFAVVAAGWLAALLVLPRASQAQ
jgi:MFS family permease